MEAYVRGFSFMPNNNKMEVVDIEEALEKTWRHTRRERLKQREQKIWEEFLKEKDIVSTVCEDDQYQFLEDLPESCVKEIMESEVLKSKNMKQVEEPKLQEPPPVQEEQQTVTNILEDDDCDDCDIFHIFYDEKDDQSPVDEEVLNDSVNSAPATVREKQSEEKENVEFERPSSGSNTISTDKSSENLTNVIESSIYCAKVKELRMKINDELLDMMSVLDRRDLFNMESEEILRMIKRSAEFCSRFNRIYMYQLQRQMQDINRNNSVTLPFAKHTQFQSQRVRIVSLHQNLLQSFQVFRKSVEQTCCVRESVSALGALVGAARAATDLCAAVSCPRGLAAAADLQLYDDNLLTSCDKLEQFVNEYAVRCEEFLMGYPSMIKTRAKKVKEPKKTKKRSINLNKSTKNNSEAEARLSMYSSGTLHSNPKSSCFKDTQCSKIQGRSTVNGAKSDKSSVVDKAKTPRTPRYRSPRSRRPLMRDPHEGRPRVPRGTGASRSLRDDIPTMVESVVVACTSSHMLHEENPRQKPSLRAKGIHIEDLNRRTQPNTPRRKRVVQQKLIQGGMPNVGHEPHYRKNSGKVKKTEEEKKNEEKKRTKDEIENLEEMRYRDDIYKEDNIYQEDKKCQQEKRSIKDSKVDEGTNPSVDVENDTSSAESLKPNSLNNVTAKYKSPRTVKLGPVKSVLVRPMPAKVEPPETLTESTESHQLKAEELKSPNRKPSRSTERCEGTRLLQQLCSSDTSSVRGEQATGAKNVQLLNVNGSSLCGQPSTPQLLRILEENIQRKVPLKKARSNEAEKYRLNFNIAESVSDNMFQYRTKFVQHMLTSPMYANSAVGKPWEMIDSISEQIIDDLLINCVHDMELYQYIYYLYMQETTAV